VNHLLPFLSDFDRVAQLRRSARILAAIALIALLAEASPAQDTPAKDAATPVPILSFWGAAAAGDLDRIKQLVDSGSDVNAIGGPEREPLLITALKANQPQVALFLLDHGADVNCKGAGGDSPLSHAARFGMIGVIQRLIDMGGDVRALDSRHRFPLHYAVERNDLAAARLLIPGPAVANEPDVFGKAPLDLAIASASQEMVLLLTNAGARFNTSAEAAIERIDLCVQKRWYDAIDRAIQQTAKAPNVRKTILDRAYSTAFASGDVDLLKRLADQGATVNGPTSTGDSQLLLAVSQSHTEVVKTLIESGADVKQTAPFSAWTALHSSSLQADTGTTQLLLGKGADPNALDGLGRTPLHIAAHASSPDIVSILLAAGADPARIDSLGNSALHYAAASGSLAVTKALVDAHCPQSPNKVGKTPQDLASEFAHADVQAILQPSVLDPEGYGEVVRLLADGPGPKLIADAHDRWISLASHGTPLIHIAVQAQSLKAVQNLLNKDPKQLTARDPEGNLPIHIAAELPDSAILSELLARGAPVNDSGNFARWTPLHFAVEAGSLPALQLLLSKGADPKALDAAGLSPKDVATRAHHPEVLAALP